MGIDTEGCGADGDHRFRGGLFRALLVLSVLICSGQVSATDEEGVELGITEYTSTDEAHAAKRVKPPSKSTADHGKMEELQGPFASGPEVTSACLACHNTAGHQFMENKHWTWRYRHPETGQLLGKSVLVNNFCTNARGNEGMCAQCHAGYNMSGPDFDFTNQENIDCLVCHESTGTYYKTPTSKGNEACSIMFEGKPPIDWATVAQSVAMPQRNNCGKCHFYGGGGDNVKHGDLSSVLFDPPRAVDVHMSREGGDFRCTTCHVGEGHDWAGSRYQMTVGDAQKPVKPGMPRETATCAGCHGAKPHPIDSVVGVKLNSHTDQVACESCHIPAIARGGVATKVEWDWRTMGRLKNGEGFKLKEYTQGDGEHRATYKSIKGSFVYAEELQPEYAWFDGAMRYTTIDTRFDPDAGPVEINGFSGEYGDPASRIYPFKRMRTIQPYDKGNNTLVYLHLWGDDENALWGNYDFARAIKAGMAENGIPYSGEFGFVETHSFWPVNHMVAPKEDALACEACHAPEGRLNHLEGFYMPGTGSHRLLDLIGLLAIFGALAGVLGHGLIRVIASSRRKQ